jgi:hypothetical protein
MQTADVELGMMRPGMSINSCLANLFHVLNFEKACIVRAAPLRQ